MIKQAIAGLILSTLALTATPATAEPADPGRIDALVEAIYLREMVQIVREEGIAEAPEIASNMFPGRGGPGWRATVAEIYDVSRIWAAIEPVLLAELGSEAVEVNLAFFSTGLGAQLVLSEYEGRRAMLDPDVDGAARSLALDLMQAGDPRLDDFVPLVEAYDLVEANVVGGLNTSVGFFMGLQEGGALNDSLSEAQILAEVWGQEPDIRADTLEWLNAYLLLAYADFDAQELERYAAFARTDAAQELNKAIFAAFDIVFERISLELGRAVAQRMRAEDI